MGCVSSKSSIPDPISSTPHQTNVAVEQKNIVQDQVIAAEKIANVPKPKVQVTDKDRAQLKVKSMKDKVENFVMKSDLIMKEDARLALQAKQDGNLATAKMFLQRRKRLKKRVDMQLGNVERLAQMVDAMDEAQQNEKLFTALEQGTKTINDIMDKMKPHQVEKILAESRQAKDRVQEVNEILGLDASLDDIPDDQLEMEFDLLEKEFEAQNNQQSVNDKVQSVPDVPTEIPTLPVSTDMQQDPSPAQQLAAA